MTILSKRGLSVSVLRLQVIFLYKSSQEVHITVVLSNSLFIYGVKMQAYVHY